MSTTTVPVFDPVQLNRHTKGNPGLQVEMLSLFVNEVERLMRQIEGAADPQLRTERLRALIGTARNIGATLLASEARALEAQIAEESPDLTGLKVAVESTLAHIRRSGV